MQLLDGEIFLQIPGTNYYISNKGRYYNTLSKRTSYGCLGLNGYMYFGLGCIHRYVAMLFIPNPEKLPEVNHKDEDKTNNDVSNLEWISKQDNLNYGTHNKRSAEGKRGKRYPKQQEAARRKVERNGGLAIPNFSSKGLHWKYDKELGKRVFYS